jgi:hypothetical protein
MREERKKRKSLRKIVECKPHSVENAPQPEDEVVTVSKPKENPYYRQILRLKKRFRIGIICLTKRMIQRIG